MKLKYKLSGIIFLLILLVSVINYQLLTKTFHVLQVKRLETAEALLGESLANKLYRMVVERDQKSVVAYLFSEKVLREEKLQYLVVNDREGNLFAHTYLTDVPASIEQLNNTFSDKQNNRVDDLLESELGVYNIGIPIREGVIQVGTLHIGIKKDFILDAVSPLKRASEGMLIFAVLFFFFGAVLAFYFSYAITRSLTRLQTWSIKLSEGEYDVDIDIKSHDEVGRLAASFMRMRDSVQEAHKKLEQQNQNLEATVAERTRELSRAQKLESIGTLAAGVAHEINTPVQFISDNAVFAKDAVKDLFEIIDKYKQMIADLDDATTRTKLEQKIDQIEEDGDLEYLVLELPKALTQTKEGADHVGHIVKAMKEFSHIGSQEDAQYEDLNQAIDAALTISKNEWKYVAENQTEFEAELPHVKCHIGEVKQVVLNLVVNAAHAIGDKKAAEQSTGLGLIFVSTRSEHGFVKVSVSDNGSGISAEHKEQIFDPFFTTKEVGKGTGQGLSSAYQIIVDQHGGKIWFEDNPEGGTIFFFTLPIDGMSPPAK